ncbi:MAG: integrase family protein [Moraxellaceae bacterium]|nr:integrase family protein [Moraxellaceae bacterium]
MPLTDTFLKTVKYTRTDNKPQREYDTDGLYLEITPKGVKKWLMKYKRPITAKENRLSFGTYADVSLKDARKKRGAYLRTQFMPERHKMMQWYANYLDGLQVGNVVSVRFGGAA